MFECSTIRPSTIIRQTFFRQIDFFADSPNFNPSKLSSFTVYTVYISKLSIVFIANRTHCNDVRVCVLSYNNKHLQVVILSCCYVYCCSHWSQYDSWRSLQPRVTILHKSIRYHFLVQSIIIIQYTAKHLRGNFCSYDRK